MSATFELIAGKEADIHLYNVNKYLAPFILRQEKPTYKLLTDYHNLILFLRKSVPDFDSFDRYKYPISIQPLKH